MKVYYMNDERQDVVVRIMDKNYDCVNATGDTYVTLKPCEARVFDVELPEDSILYIKKWPKMVMFSFERQTTQPDPAQSSRVQPPQDTL